MEKKVKDYDGLYRTDSGAVINKDYASYKSFIENHRRMVTSEIKIKNLENDVSEIKDMLRQLLDQKTSQG